MLYISLLKGELIMGVMNNGAGSLKIYCRLAVLMAEKDPKLFQHKVAFDTGLAITTINRLFNNKFDRMDIHTLEVLCQYFGCNISDLITLRQS
uniref:Transcriptional regulator, XRE family n=1 Tax=Cyanothece sp. (strain PCC 7425 / ATCC 29141) TaxID=395961 RepID=B8HZ64_CYAP4